MQTAISWGNYVTGLIIISVAYYIFVAAKFYRQEITMFLSGKWKPAISMKCKNTTTEQEESSGPYGRAMEGSFDELEEVVEDLRTAILDQAGKQTGKDEILQILQQRLANYSGLRKPAFRVAVNHYIIRQAEETCKVAFSEQELNEAWEALPR